MTTAKSFTGANAKQVAGDHYKVDYQHWDMLIGLGFNSEYYIGQATKYITRWRKKNGIRDLKKGQHFVEKMIELVQVHGNGFLRFGKRGDWDISELVTRHADTHLRRFFTDNEVGIDEQAICICIIFANSTTQLQTAKEEIDKLIEKAAKEENATAPTDKELPVSREYEFMGYTDHDSMRWRKKATGQVQELPLTTPPTLADWADTVVAASSGIGINIGDGEVHPGS